MQSGLLKIVAMVSVCACWCAWLGCAAADDPAASNPAAAAQSDRVIAALKLGVPMIEKAAARYPQHRKCFSCHHQTLPMLAMAAARGTGLTVDEAVFQSQAEFTHQAFTGQIEALRKGEGIGGRALTVAYGLAALELAVWPADETTAAMTTYLIKMQHDDGHWQVQTVRPPSEESSEMCTARAVAGLQKWAPAEAGEEQDKIDATLVKAKTWLLSATPKSQEDRVARLWGLHLLGASDEDLQTARRAALQLQRDDGGWPQLEEMESDAYATGQTLFFLQATGLTSDAPQCQRAVEFLLKTQGDDGTWHVKTRSKPIQVYFDNGDPHDHDQFISTPSTCWALAALARCQKKQ